MNQTQPDSQKTPFGPSQLSWLNEKYGTMFCRVIRIERNVK